MEKILGIDTGTNSIGWAVIEREGNYYKLIDKGVNIFQEGVKIEKGIESSKAAERTEYRSARIRYYRRKLRKLRLLRVLIDNHLCPPVSSSELSAWRLKKQYPMDESFLQWQRTDDDKDVNPYHDRVLCLKEKLDLSDLSQRYLLGRALYHLAQRRGFLSNRKVSTEEIDGTVKSGIDELSRDIQNNGCAYLGEYFYKLYHQGKKIRNHYTARKEHYLKEFIAICSMQQLDSELSEKLEQAIFYQKPLKSQKGTVGQCRFEKNKAKCSTSHPLYEEFRMLCFINNIKIKTPQDDKLRSLSKEEREHIAHLFYRKSKCTFNFEEIAKDLAGKDNYGYYKTESQKPYLFNYYMDTTVSGCCVTAQLIDVFGDNWIDMIEQCYTLRKDKTRLQLINDIWHALFFYSDEDKLKLFAMNRLLLSEDKASKFAKILLPNDYAALSLKAISLILPYLRKGLLYSHAVFLAKLCDIIPHYIWEVADSREFIIDEVSKIIQQYDSTIEARTVEQCVKDFIKDNFDVAEKELDKLYHPSMLEVYPRVRPNDLGEYQLGSPRIDSVRNPMAMHSMFRIRAVVNCLLKQKIIDENTIIHIEFARELNDANKRKAIADWQRANEKEREQCTKDIIELYKEETGQTIIPTDDEILKYQLWKEQKKLCIYTGDNIGITQFIGENPSYDIEHTIPQSAGGDSTRMNLTLCNSRFNREVKGTKLPSQLSNHEDILTHIEEWKERYIDLDEQIRELRGQIRKLRGVSAVTKETKDRIIQKRHLLELDRDYWKGKYERFTMTEVPEGFSRRQGTDISVISRYARLYLKSVFRQVYIVKGIATADFRKIWGIQEAYKKKERINHIHHLIDAITIACIGKAEYDKVAHFYKDKDRHELYGAPKPTFAQPWRNFVADIKNIQDEVLVSHYTPNNLPKQDKKRIKGVKEGRKYAQGDTARGSLHNDTYYGAIEKDGEIKYVVRKRLGSLKESDVKNIVDEVVKQKIEDAIAKYGFKEAMVSNIWMNEEKRIPIRKVRYFTPSVTRPLNIRQQRDLSNHDYKRQYHVTNDRNYMFALYIGTNKGKKKRDFEIINNIDAASFYKRSWDKEPSGNQIVPQQSKNGYPLAYCLRIGTMVLLYEKSPEEIWEGDIEEIQKRLYKVTGMSTLRVPNKSYGTITLLHHQEARPSGALKLSKGAFQKNNLYRPIIFLYHTQLNALVQGYDFEIDELGKIKRLRHD